MANHAVLIQNRVAAQDVGSWNRSAVAASSIDLDNGNVFQLSGSAADTGYSEVWWVTAPVGSAITLSDLWMAASTETVSLTVDGDLKYRGLNSDPRKFYNSGCTVFSAFRPQPGDIITLSVDAFTGTTNTYANGSDGSYTLYWNSAQSASALSFKKLATTYISIGSGAMDTQRVTAYKMLCVNNGPGLY
jgi:hypothetical protein